MKRINIQQDVESRRSIAQELPAIPKTEPVVEPEKEEQNTENKTPKDHEVNTSPVSNSNRKKEDGRPTGTYKRFLFEETGLGFFLKYEVPVVYEIVMRLTPPAAFPEPPLYIIDIVCGTSKDPSLKKAKFFRDREEYVSLGLYCRRAKRPTPNRKYIMKVSCKRS